MRIGGFYGFTVPMLIPVYDEQMQRILKTFNGKLNTYATLDLRKELWHFRRALTMLPRELSSEDNSLNEFLDSATVIAGKIVGKYMEQPDSDEIEHQIMQALCDACGKRLYEQMIRGKFYDVRDLEDSSSFMPKLFELVKTAMIGKTFSLTNVNVLYRAFLKLLSADNSVGNYDVVKRNIRMFCNLREYTPNQIFMDGELITLTEQEIKVIDYYRSNINVIDKMAKCVDISGYADEKIFGVSFIDFLNRKPTSLYYMVLQQFDHLKNSDIKLFPNVLDKVKTEFGTCKNMIDSYLASNQAENSMVSRDELINVYSDLDEDLVTFLLESYDIANVNEISTIDLDNLVVLYNAARFLSLDNLNSIWETELSEEDFKVMASKFDKLHLGGMTLLTNKLFKESLNEIIFVSNLKVSRSEEYVSELKQICKDVDALLSTFKPIGGELYV